ncbi:DUF6385 domain-containing protein [Zhaonella formicivorans]|uniref:DUF6385 domain-containing protein n=1 Tax=Zhaonella formicivorans TaxID=2528593 RepID=UPI001D114443|nr:DUF6385 domain-containing protein [Zhaonella formicivorans]
MPNFKVFQDVPDQARVKIFGSNDVAFNTDSSGNLTITSTGLAITAPANGLTVTAPASGLSITPPTGGLSITPPTNGLSITSTGLAITAPANGLTVTAPASGLSITPPTGGLLITTTGLAVATATTDVSATRANITDTAGTPDTTYTVLDLKTWTFGVVNNSLVANAQALVTLQISPDGTTWNDHVGPVTINQNALQTFVSSIFLKYARLYYSAVSAASAVTLNIFFQGQS